MTTMLAAEVAAAAGRGWILDVIFFVMLFLGAGIGTRIGFVKGVCRIAGWILSIVIPFMFCAPLRRRWKDGFNFARR